jgi:hypothetical protein
MHHPTYRIGAPLRATCSAVVTVLFGAMLAHCAASETATRPTELTARSLYPLAAGNAWSYDVDTGDGSAILAITRVTEVRGNVAEVVTGETPNRYQLRRDGIWRIERGAYLLRGPIAPGARWPSGGGLTATVARIGLRVDTPAGRFERCVEIREDGTLTGGTIHTTYCPEVGPVLVRTETQLSHATARIQARLRGYAVTGTGGGSSGTASSAR